MIDWGSLDENQKDHMVMRMTTIELAREVVRILRMGKHVPAALREELGWRNGMMAKTGH